MSIWETSFSYYGKILIIDRWSSLDSQPKVEMNSWHHFTKGYKKWTEGSLLSLQKHLIHVFRIRIDPLFLVYLLSESQVLRRIPKAFFSLSWQTRVAVHCSLVAKSLARGLSFRIIFSSSANPTLATTNQRRQVFLAEEGTLCCEYTQVCVPLVFFSLSDLLAQIGRSLNGAKKGGKSFIFLRPLHSFFSLVIAPWMRRLNYIFMEIMVTVICI